MIGIISALQQETDLIKAKMTDMNIRSISGIEFCSGQLGGKSVVIAVCGIGKVYSAVCAQTMILEFSPDIIINTGVGGGLSNKPGIGGVVIADKVVQHDMDVSPLGHEPGYIIGIDSVSIPCCEHAVSLLSSIAAELGFSFAVGTVATGDAFINSSEKRAGLYKQFGALSCEMEGGSIGQVCKINNVPFAVIRAISDSADGSSHVDFSAFLKKASENSEKAVELFISRF